MSEYADGPLIGHSRAMNALRAEIARIGTSRARVLITGESGVGKEVVAHAAHAASGGSGPFVAVNCAGIPEMLLESELFGHVRGSFTGAYVDRVGKLELPRGGTLFLDEIGEMSLRMQGMLLRYLETGEVQKLGTERPVVAHDVRVMAATNRDLRQQIAAGHFREDLLYRLDVIHVHVPPLREHREDIPPLVDHFMARFAAQYGRRVRVISPAADAWLTQCQWPGNVRQLKNVLERAVVTAQAEVIGIDDLPADLQGGIDLSARRAAEPAAASVSAELFRRLVEDRESFWTAVYPLYMNREITKAHIRELVDRALRHSRGNYKTVLGLFNMEPQDYKRFLNFLKKHNCQLPFMAYRQ